MTMKNIEDMNAVDMELMVETLLGIGAEPADVKQEESKSASLNTPMVCLEDLAVQHKGGFRRGELNVICSGGATR